LGLGCENSNEIFKNFRLLFQNGSGKILLLERLGAPLTWALKSFKQPQPYLWILTV
jgi:hypothetical protein